MRATRTTVWDMGTADDKFRSRSARLQEVIGLPCLPDPRLVVCLSPLSWSRASPATWRTSGYPHSPPARGLGGQTLPVVLPFTSPHQGQRVMQRSTPQPPSDVCACVIKAAELLGSVGVLDVDLHPALVTP